MSRAVRRRAGPPAMTPEPVPPTTVAAGLPPERTRLESRGTTPMSASSQPPRYHAVRHILSAPLIDDRTRAYVDEETIDWNGLEREAASMSDGGRFLVSVAVDLWSAEKRTGVYEISSRLDQPNFERVVDALRIARGTSSSSL